MMSLPKLTDSAPTVAKLRTEARRLRAQADALLAQTGLLEILQQYGVLAPIGGSYAYDLMVYPDLDLQVINETVTTSDFAAMVADFVKNPFVRKISTANNIDFRSPRTERPQGYWLGLEIPFENDYWGGDCWVQQSAWADAQPNVYDSLLHNLDDARRDAILNIKYQLIYRGLYGKTYWSVDVYDAVLHKDVRTVDDFLSKNFSRT